MRRRFNETFQGVMRLCLRCGDRWIGFFRFQLRRLKRSRISTLFGLLPRHSDKRVARRTGRVPVVTFDAGRRAFVRYTLFGGVVFLAGKYLTPTLNMFRGDTVIDEKVFRNFTLTETGKQLRVTDDQGSEILTIDKESF